MDSECIICIHFSKKNFRGRPPDRTCRRGISTPASIQPRVKNFPHHVYRSGALKTKITQKVLGKNQHAIGKKWTQNAPFASIFLKKFPGGGPRTPICERGIPPPAPSPYGASRRFGYAPPRQWTLWIRHWNKIFIKQRLTSLILIIL